jgi:hypothetical protein
MSNMSQNQEIIEAKLCAYIDGVLDAEGRAEIEKHLEANPQHRRLLESLRATRDLLRWLPREPAPPELAESLNGQLERSVLLDYDGAALRPSRWPRILAAAAIIALTAGLGVAVFMALPGSQKNPAMAFHGDGQAQTVPSDTPAPSLAAAPSTDLEAQGATEREHEEMALAKAGEPSSLKDGADQALAAGRSADGAKLDETESVRKTAELDQLASAVSQDPAAFVAAASNDGAAATEPAGPASNAVVLLVRSNSPQATEQQLTRYFVSNQIRWRQAPAGQLESIARNDTIGNAGRGGNYAAKSLPEPIQGKPLDTPPTDAQKNAPPARNRGAQSQPSQDFAINGAPSGNVPLPEALAQNVTPRQSISQRQAIQGNLSNRYENNGVYNGAYVAQMSRRQAALLNSAINRREVRASGLNQSTQSDGLEFNAGAGGNADNEKTALSSAPARPAAGATEPGAPTTNRSNDGRDFRDRDAILGRAPRARRPLNSFGDKQASPTTQPTDGLRPDDENDSTVLRAKAGFGRGRRDRMRQQAELIDATQPSQYLGLGPEPATRSADEPVNVVILVQPDEPEVSDQATTKPATQPAAPNSPEAPQTQPSR